MLMLQSTAFVVMCVWRLACCAVNMIAVKRWDHLQRYVSWAWQWRIMPVQYSSIPGDLTSVM